MGKRPTKKSAGGLIGFEEMARALDLIRQGKSDAAIAATISAARPHGQFRIDPSHIAQVRKDA